jgi:hypothetical protein
MAQHRESGLDTLMDLLDIEDLFGEVDCGV